jgi:hypothetical protein
LIRVDGRGTAETGPLGSVADAGMLCGRAPRRAPVIWSEGLTIGVGRLRALANLLRDGSKRETRPRRLPMRSGNSSAGLGKPDEVARPSEESSTRAMALDKACGSTLLGKWCMNLRSVPHPSEDDHLLTRNSVPWHSVLLARIDITLGLDRDWSLAGHQLARSS